LGGIGLLELTKKGSESYTSLKGYNMTKDMFGKQVPENLTAVTIYTDGSCSPNPGKGGWGCVLIAKIKGGEYIKCISGYSPENPTTNNRMELQSIIEGISAIKNPEKIKVTIYADSQWAINALQGTWNVKKNLDLVKQGKDLLNKFGYFEFVWVKGHADNQWNEKANDIAMKAITDEKGNIEIL
jgi:ribonuclease HI